MSSEQSRGTSDRRRVSAPRADETREWAVFVRETPAEPLRHVGSVTAPSADVAHVAAGSLFDHTAETIWCAPTDAVARFTTRELGSEYAEETGDRTPEGDRDDADDSREATR